MYSALLDKYYYGHTCETLDARLIKHLQKHRGFTSRLKDWQVVYSESFPSKEDAYAREREVKGWKNRKLIEDLIKRK